jgi:hypothetical protein
MLWEHLALGLATVLGKALVRRSIMVGVVGGILHGHIFQLGLVGVLLDRGRLSLAIQRLSRLAALGARYLVDSIECSNETAVLAG